jgi:hypothetical protein
MEKYGKIHPKETDDRLREEPNDSKFVPKPGPRKPNQAAKKD